MVLGNTYERVIWASRRIVTHRWRNADLKGLGSEPHCTPNTWAASPPPLAVHSFLLAFPATLSSRCWAVSFLFMSHAGCASEDHQDGKAPACAFSFTGGWNEVITSFPPLLFFPLCSSDLHLFSSPLLLGAWYTSSKLCLLNDSSSVQTPHF